MSERKKNLGVKQILCRDDDEIIKINGRIAEYLSMTGI